MTQKYDKEFKLHAVQLALENGKPASQVARELGVSQKTLYGWMAKYKEDPSTPFVGSGNLRPEAKALRDLERENRELREEVAILNPDFDGLALIGGRQDGNPKVILNWSPRSAF